MRRASSFCFLWSAAAAQHVDRADDDLQPAWHVVDDARGRAPDLAGEGARGAGGLAQENETAGGYPLGLHGMYVLT
jgi:hypothetical protein